MATDEKQPLEFSGFGLGLVPQNQPDDGVFILVVYREGSVTAAAHATERSAMEAAVEYLEDEQEEGDEGGSPEDRYARAQSFLADEGGLMEIIPSPIYGG